MKKVVQLAIPALLSISPMWGMESNNKVGVIDDPFFCKMGVKTEITLVYENGPNVLAKIKAQDPSTGEEQIRRIPALWAPLGWEYNEDNTPSPFARQKIIAQIECGNQIITSEPYTRLEKIPYQLLTTSQVTLLNGNSVLEADISLGEKVDILYEKVYSRPDKTTYTQRGVPVSQAIAHAISKGTVMRGDNLFTQLPLGEVVDVHLHEINQDPKTGKIIYQLLLEENRVAQGMVYRCWKHENEWQQRGLRGYNQLRHWWESYDTTEITPQIYKLLMSGQKTLFLTGQPELVQRLTSRDEGRTNKPECASPYGQGFPPNSKRI